MPEPIEIPEPKKGVRPDLDPEDIEDSALFRAENMIFRDGDFKTRPGFATFANDINERPLAYIQYSNVDGATKVVMGTDKGWWLLSSNTWTSITGTALTGSETDFVVFRTFVKGVVTYLLGTNGKDTAKKWDGSAGAYSAIGGSPPKARCMAVLFNRCVLGNLTSGDTIHPAAIDVSNDKDMDTGWGTQLVAIVGTDSPIVTIRELSDQTAAILKSDEIHLLIAQSGTTPFRPQFVKSGISGPASEKMAARLTEGSVVMVGKDGLASIFDGAAVQELPYSIQKQIVSTCNPEKMDRGWCTYDSDRRELWIMFPLQGSVDPNGGVMVNMGTLQVYPIRFAALKMTAGRKIKTATGVSIGDLTVPIGSLTQTLGDLGSNSAVRRLVFGDIGGQSFQDTATKDNAVSIPFSWETPVRGKAEHFGTIERIRHRFKPSAMSQTVSVQVGKRNEAGDIAYGTAKSLNAGSTRRKVTGHRVTAEYFALRFSGDAHEDVNYMGSTAYLVPRGRR